MKRDSETGIIAVESSQVGVIGWSCLNFVEYKHTYDVLAYLNCSFNHATKN